MSPYRLYSYATNQDPLHVTYDELRPVRSGEMIVKVHSAALNPVDIVLYNSAYWPFSYYNSKQGLGRDYSGVVHAVSPDVSEKLGFEVGDRVCGLYTHPLGRGTVSEYITLNPLTLDPAVVAVPVLLSMEQAASFPLVALTACLMMAGHKLEGAKVLVLGGATLVGRFVTQIARVRGARTIVTTNSARLNDAVKELGLTAQIDYHDHPLLKQPVLEAAKDGPFHYIYDCIGNADLIDVLPAILDKETNGYVTIVGDYKYTYPQEHFGLVAMYVLRGLVRGFGSLIGYNGYNYRIDMLVPSKAHIDYLSQLFTSGKLTTAIDSVSPFSDTPEVFQKLLDGKASGKLVIKVQE